MNIPKRMNGINIKKIKCQDANWISTPLMDGPNAGANDKTNPSIPIALPRLLFSKVIKMVLDINGNKIPIPIACKILATNNILKFKARPPVNVPISKLVVAIKNSLLVVNICINNAVTGIIIPRVNRYPVVSHCAVDALILKTPINVVKAMFRDVSLNIPMNALISIAINILFGLIVLFIKPHTLNT